MNTSMSDDGGKTWRPAQSMGWVEEHNLWQRFVFWLLGVEHCNDREGQRRKRFRR